MAVAESCVNWYMSGVDSWCRSVVDYAKWTDKTVAFLESAPISHAFWHQEDDHGRHK